MFREEHSNRNIVLQKQDMDNSKKNKSLHLFKKMPYIENTILFFLQVFFHFNN